MISSAISYVKHHDQASLPAICPLSSVPGHRELRARARLEESDVAFFISAADRVSYAR
jgi:hypothetical protein